MSSLLFYNDRLPIRFEETVVSTKPSLAEQAHDAYKFLSAHGLELGPLHDYTYEYYDILDTLEDICPISAEIVHTDNMLAFQPIKDETGPYEAWMEYQLSQEDPIL